MSTLRITDAPLLPDVDGTEKIPTGGRGDYAISVDQIKDHIFQDVGKDLVGLGNVDNTSDLDKPVSTAQQAALNLKADKTYVDTNLDLKADKTNVYTRTETSLALSLKADLVNGVVPENQIPSSFNDVLEFTTVNLPIVGESGKIYVTTDNNKTWRWGGNKYVEISGWNPDSVSKSVTLPTYYTKEAGVDPVTGVAEGVYFNVRSTDDDTILVEYQNIGGVPTPSGRSYPSSGVVKKIADYTALPFVGGKTYRLNERVKLANGDIVKSTIDGNTNDPDVNMTGWVSIGNINEVKSIAELLAIQNPVDGQCAYVKSYYTGSLVGGGTFVYNSANTIVYDGGVSFGKWRRQFNILTPQDFGVVGNYSTATLSSLFSSLAEAKSWYSGATSLAELADRVAYDHFLKYCITNTVSSNWSAKILVDKPLVSYTDAKSLYATGEVTFKSHQTKLPYVLHIATSAMVYDGSITFQGTQQVWDDMRTRLLNHGVVFGAVPELGLSGNAVNCDFRTVIGSNLLGFAFHLGTNAHFTKASQVRGETCGSAINHATYPYLQGLPDSYYWVSDAGYDQSQVSVIRVLQTAFLATLQAAGPVRVMINNLPYDVNTVDTAKGQITIRPALPASARTGSLLYQFGGALFINSNNTACTTFSTVQAIVCGYGLCVPALYGANVATFISEFCGIAIGLSAKNDTTLGSTVGLAYFEANNADIVYGWSLSSYSSLKIEHSIALNPDKIHNLYSYDFQGKRRPDWNRMGSGSVDYNGNELSVVGNPFDITKTTHDVLVLVWAGSQGYIAYDPKIAELTGRYSKTVHVAAANSDPVSLTLIPPAGYTIGGQASYTVNVSNYVGSIAISLSVNESLYATETNINVVIGGTLKTLKGTTAQRPANPYQGQRYFDTTLLASGKPIEWNGVGWVDSTGTAV